MDNAEAIISFIDEVTRNNETAVAVRGLGTAPIANWIWPFASFGQVRQAIDPLVLNGLATRDASGRKALEEQLYTILQDIVPKIKDAPMKIGRASCRERVCQYVSISWGAVSIKKKLKN